MALLLAASLFGALSSGAFAASAAAPTYQTEHDLYTQALANGDAKAAAEHALAAWKAAEKELGDSRLTAALAYDYAKLIIFDDPAGALEALKRAKQLQDAGIADLPAPELRVYLAYAAFKQAGSDRKAASALRDALQEAEADKTDLGSPLPKFWLDLAQSQLDFGQYRGARKSASKAEQAIDANQHDAYRQKARALLISGEGQLLEPPPTLIRTQDALSDFRKGEFLFPPQTDIDSYDPILAQLLAWDNVTAATLMSGFHRNPSDVACSDCAPTDIQGQKPDDDCNIEWARQDPPQYPYPSKQVRNDFIIAGVIIGYRFGEDLKVHDAKLLAQVGGSSYAENSLKAMAGWRLKALPEDPACRGDRLASFLFAVR